MTDCFVRMSEQETCSFALDDEKSFRALNCMGTYGREKKRGWSKLRNTKIQFVIFTKYYYVYQIKDELSCTQGRCGEIRNAYRIFVRNVKGDII